MTQTDVLLGTGCNTTSSYHLLAYTPQYIHFINESNESEYVLIHGKLHGVTATNQAARSTCVYKHPTLYHTNGHWGKISMANTCVHHNVLMQRAGRIMRCHLDWELMNSTCLTEALATLYRTTQKCGSFSAPYLSTGEYGEISCSAEGTFPDRRCRGIHARRNPPCGGHGRQSGCGRAWLWRWAARTTSYVEIWGAVN